MIVKIQRPLFSTNADYTECLIYDENREIQFSIHDPSVFNLFGEGEYKIYHRAHMKGSILHIDERVEDQNF